MPGSLPFGELLILRTPEPATHVCLSVASLVNPLGSRASPLPGPVACHYTLCSSPKVHVL